MKLTQIYFNGAVPIVQDGWLFKDMNLVLNPKNRESRTTDVVVIKSESEDKSEEGNYQFIPDGFLLTTKTKGKPIASVVNDIEPDKNKDHIFLAIIVNGFIKITSNKSEFRVKLKKSLKINTGDETVIIVFTFNKKHKIGFTLTKGGKINRFRLKYNEEKEHLTIKKIGLIARLINFLKN